MATSFPRLPDRPLIKRGRTDETVNFLTKPKEIFPCFHVIHSESPDKTVRTLSPFLVSKSLTDALGPGYKVTKLASGDLLLEVHDKTQYERLTNLVAFGDIRVSVTPHRSLNTTRGVVSEQDLLDLSEAELLEGWKEEHVINVQRIKIRRDDKEIPTKHLILTFHTSTLPEYVQTGYVKIRVRPYIPNPRRCFKCQRFGHGSQSCRGRSTCAKCASHDHAADDCKDTPHCANCDGEHAAYSRTCPSWKKEKQIITLKVKENISFKEARKRYSFVQGPTFSEVARQGAVPQRFSAAVRTTQSGPAVAPPAPKAASASAVPSLERKNQQAFGAAGSKTSRATASADKPETPASGHRERASSASAEAMDTTPSASASPTPKDRRSSQERAKRDKTLITGPGKGPVR